MERNLPLVSINLLTWNGEKYIEDCLNSVFNQSYSNLKILIIDNNSTDKTIKYLKKIKDRSKNLKVIFNKKNIGFSAGHNQGIEQSKGDFILCLNQDAVLGNNFIQNIVEVFNRDKKIASVQGKVLRWQKGLPISNQNSDYDVSRIIDTTGLLVLKNRRIINRSQGEIDQEQFNKVEEIFGPDGAVPVYRREALEDVKIGKEYFDESFFAYKEDVDLAWRLRLYGWKSFYQPKSVAYHDRTAGDSFALSYINIIKERLKINKFGKYLAFKNQRLMQIKNEQIGLLIRHLPWILPKEIGSWLYVLILEKYTWRAIGDLFKQIPQAWKKRKIIMSRKKVSAKEMKQWFK
ncbi:MAG: glycosyltransferase family 2 protein [Patescibacteria group bacterium]|nr:glycosyltransferase family 2 protein [Patescibacteria group bacterium]